ncbi:MAG: MOSC domain-containing protein [Flavobacteriales bacterium]|nr:MOSC domain-containing protein [Flavobacteriales bacterium]
MSDLTLASIRCYPIKSLGGFSVKEAQLTDRGLEHDRRWMFVDEAGVFLSQRELAMMACLHTSALPDGFRITDMRDGSSLDLPWRISKGANLTTRIWDDSVDTLVGDVAWSQWLSDRVGRSVRLVFMPNATNRITDVRYAESLTSLSDGFPYLIVSQASLDDLNARLEEPVPMERFRPNLVITGGSAFQEDAWKKIAIGAVNFQLVKPCARCMIITTDQRTGQRGKEPLRTLATYRGDGEKVLFGMNAIGSTSGMIRAGDQVTVLS